MKGWSVAEALQSPAGCFSAVFGALTSGASYADVSLSKDLGECPVGPISHDFSNDAAKKGIKINTGNCTRPGAFNWNGAVASYSGMVHSGDNASGTHSGQFEGKGEWIANGGAGGAGGKNEVDWSAELTGKGEKKFIVNEPQSYPEIRPTAISAEGIATSKAKIKLTLSIKKLGEGGKEYFLEQVESKEAVDKYTISWDRRVVLSYGKYIVKGVAIFDDGSKLMGENSFVYESFSRERKYKSIMYQ